MKKLLQLYGKPSLFLFCVVGIVLLYFVIVQNFFPLSPMERCSNQPVPWYRSGGFIGEASTVVLMATAFVGALNLLIGFFGSLYYAFSKKKSTKPNSYGWLIVRGVMTLATAFVLYFAFSVALGFIGFTSCPLQLPYVPK